LAAETAPVGTKPKFPKIAILKPISGDDFLVERPHVCNFSRHSA